MANDPATSSEALQPANATPTGAGPGYNYLSGLLIFVLALYLVVVTGVALYAMIELWPHPTPAGEPPSTDTTKTDTTKTDTTKTDTAKTDTAKTDTAKTGTAKTGTAKTDTAKTDTTKSDTTKTDTTSSDKKPSAAGRGGIPLPTAEEIKARRARLCGTDEKCGACIEQELQLQYESQRRYDPQCVQIFGCYFILWQEKRLLLLVLLAGALGALLHSLRYLSWFVGSRSFRSSWTAYYYLSPFAGAAVAFVAYIAIRGGFFSSTSTTADATFMFVALAAIAGLFSREVLEKLKKIAESAFEPAPKTTDSTASAKPMISSLDPNSVKVNFTGQVKVNGSGFTKDSKVQNSGTAMATTFVNDKQLTFMLPATSTAAPGKIDVVVKAGGATSEAKQIEVTA